MIQKLNFRVLLNSYPNYQPIFKNGKLIAGGDRNCSDRWALIKSAVTDYQASSLLDLGSAEGYYVLQSAKECGIISLGVDADVRRFSIAQSQLAAERIANAGFLFAVIDKEFLSKLPKFDVIVFLSVMHHMMYSHGIDYCRDILAQLKDKIGKAMIFEMGQSNELKNKWAKLLPNMGNNPHKWIKEFLLSAGFSSVTKIGESDSYNKDRNRAVFSVKP